MSNQSGFKKALKLGQWNEGFTKWVLHNGGFVADLEESRDQHSGDWEYTSAKGNLRFVECKMDKASTKYGNIAWELWSNKDIKKGWGVAGDSDYHYDIVASHLPGEEAIFLFPFEPMAKWMENNKDKYEQKSQHRYQQKNDSVCLIVPIRTFADVVSSIGGKVFFYDKSTFTEGQMKQWVKYT